MFFISERSHLIYFEARFPDNFKDCVLPDKVARTKGKEERLAWIGISSSIRAISRRFGYVSVRVESGK